MLKNIQPRQVLNQRRAASGLPPLIRRSASPASRLITTAIEYPNGVPHLGHGYEKVIASIFANHFRLRGEKVLLTLGLDEHSQKVANAAKAVGKTPLEFCDSLESTYKDTWASLDVGTDVFVRTSSAEHKAVVKNVLDRAHRNGDIYEKSYTLLHCKSCDEPKKPHEVRNNRCPDHNLPLRQSHERGYFFRLSKYGARLRRHIEEHPEFVQPANYRKQILDFIDGGLTDFSISRHGTQWGVPLPFEDGPLWKWTHPFTERSVTYVWFDALTNYLTVAGYGQDEQKFRDFWPADLQIVGKDIARFHAINWPAMLMSLDLPLPKTIFVHGFMTIKGEKISKSKGHGAETFRQALAYGSDALRYYFAREFSVSKDAEFNLDRLKLRNDTELANDLGNFVHGTLHLFEKEVNRVVPAVGPVAAPEGFLQQLHDYQGALDARQLGRAAILLQGLFKALNQTAEKDAPWKSFARGDRQDGELKLVRLLEMLRLVALAAWPIIPRGSEEILHRLGIEDAVPGNAASLQLQWNPEVLVGRTVRNGPHLYPRSDLR